MVSLLEINIMATLLIILILIIRAVFLRRLPKRLFTVLWLIVALRLMLPFGVPVPLDFMPAASSIPYVDRINGHSEVVYYDEIDQRTYYKSDITPADAQVFINLRSTVLIVSAEALIAAVAFIITKHVRTRRRLSDALPCEDESILTFVSGFGLRRKVRVLVSEHIVSPITFGVIKPVIIIPKERGEADLSPAIAHEMAHIKYFDIPYKLLMTALTVFYWYNPFVWVMFVRVNRDIEMACDSFALSYCGCGGEAYSDMLVGMAEKRVDMLSGSFGSGEIKLRIKSVMKSRKTGAAAVFASVVIAACSLSVFASAHTGYRTDYDWYTPVYFSKDPVVPQIWMKPQKYYREGGTKDEYIEIYDDNTLRVSGYDYMGELLAANEAYYRETFPDDTPEQLEERLDYIRNDESFIKVGEDFNKRTRYKCLPIAALALVDENGDLIGGSIGIRDENTLLINGAVYHAEEPWHAGVYPAPDAVSITPADYVSPEDGSVLSVPEVGSRYVLSDRNGNVIEEGTFTLVHLGSFDGPVIAATNIDKFPEEQPVGYYFDTDTCTFTHTVTGKVYQIKTYALLS